MKYTYTHFIPENVAPKGATRIIVKNGKKSVCSIPAARFGRMTPPVGEPLYSFGLISDPHITTSASGLFKSSLLESALRFFLEQGCVFCCDCGDSTNAGFTVGDSVDVSQFVEYKRICDLFPTLPVYNIAGNHDHYNAQLTGNYSPTLPADQTLPDGTVYLAGTPLLTLYEHYTGHGISYEVAHGNDVFLFVGQPTNGVPMSYEDRDWLAAKLEEYNGRRCFVFVHSFIDDNVKGEIEDSGNPCFARANSIFGSWGTTPTTKFMNIMKQYKKAVLFHGHSHMMFEAQEFDPCANYTDKNGFHSVHVPSVGNPRRLTADDGSWTDKEYEADIASQAYIVDVYEDCIVLNGWNLASNKPVPLGTYKIDTTLQTVEANTFTDSAGIIMT